MNPQINDRVRLVFMGDDPHPVEVGATGTVYSVTQALTVGQAETYVGVRWDNGRGLTVILPHDEIEVIGRDVSLPF